ncbi:GNAT family N-acetyltransferase [Peribacillus frigoritolerans]|uniref:GNAT family N-acetyltransferase n=1 Tax=Peribacillus frigoritolerans TaxID=450367 RepID=UPI00382F7CDA
MDIQIRKANLDDIELITSMVAKLLSELGDEAVNSKEFKDVCTELLGKERNLYTAFLAFKEDQCVGIITLSEFASLYAKGIGGVIQELYIVPNVRSQGIGDLLIDAAKEYGINRGWTRIEVGAPDAEKWNRTVSFYKREGFIEVGPRLKYPLKKIRT